MSIDCTFEEFKRMAKEFRNAASLLNQDELENAWKCLGLGYLGMNEPMWQHSAAVVLRIEARTYNQRIEELEQEEQPKCTKTCAVWLKNC